MNAKQTGLSIVLGLAAAVLMLGIVVPVPMFAQTETLPDIAPIYRASVQYVDNVPVVTWQYPLKESLPPPDFMPETIEAWIGDSGGTAAAVVEAAAVFQKAIDDTYAANNLGTAPNIFVQIQAHIRSKEIEEAFHYVRARAEQLGVSATTDPKFYVALDTIRNR